MESLTFPSKIKIRLLFLETRFEFAASLDFNVDSCLSSQFRNQDDILVCGFHPL